MEVKERRDREWHRNQLLKWKLDNLKVRAVSEMITNSDAIWEYIALKHDEELLVDLEKESKRCRSMSELDVIEPVIRATKNDIEDRLNKKKREDIYLDALQAYEKITAFLF